MKHMPLDALVVFDAIVRQGGIRPAARMLGIAHSAVSRRLAQLEQYVGEPLVHRGSGDNTRFVMTSRGSDLAVALRSHLEGLAAALESTRSRNAEKPIIVSTTNALASAWLLPRLPNLKVLHPRIGISIQITRTIVRPDLDGVDVALRMGEGPWSRSGAIEWMEEHLVPVCSPVLLGQRKVPLPLRSLRDFPLLQDGDPATTWQLWQDNVGPKRLDSRRIQVFDSSDLLIEATAQGLGVGLVRWRLAEAQVRSGRLMRPFGPYAIHLPKAYWIVPSKTALQRRSVKQFVQWLKDVGQEPGRGNN